MKATINTRKVRDWRTVRGQRGEVTTLPEVDEATAERKVSTLLQLCVFARFPCSLAFRYLTLSLFVRIFIYDLLRASNQLIFFSVKKFVERKFSPLSEKFLAGKKLLSRSICAQTILKYALTVDCYHPENSD
jgi:hypothetical protein